MTFPTDRGPSDGVDAFGLVAHRPDGLDQRVDVAATHPDLNTLHAWVHADNPEGVFNPVNPEYGGGGEH